MKTRLMITMLASLLALTACTVTSATPTPDAGAPAHTSATAAAPAAAAAWEPVACATLDVVDIVAEVADCGYITMPEKRGESGVDLSAYTSNENAADINDLRLALGYDKIIYYGQSYGTLLGQFLMRNFPEILEAVILDGTQPAEVYRGQVKLGGNPFDFDFIAFANASGADVVQAYQGNATILDVYRQGTLPALLETITVTE